MKKLLTTMILALAFAGTAQAQVLELTTWPAIPAVTAVEDTQLPETTEQEQATLAADVEADRVPCNPYREACEGHPGSPYPAAPRPNIPCGFARPCPDGSSVPVVPRPEVPPLVNLTTALVIGDKTPVQAPTYFCFVNLSAKVPGFTTGDQIMLASRATGSTGAFTPTFTINTANGTASLTVPASFATGKEWQATEMESGEKSNIVAVSNALPIICGA